MPIPYISLPQISLPKTPSWKDFLGYLGSYGTPSTSTMSSNLRRQYNEDASASKDKAEWDRLLNEAIAKKNQEILGNPTPEQQKERLDSSAASQNARLESESNASKPEPTKEDKKEQSENTAKKEEAAQESIARGNNEQQQAEEAAKDLTLGNFFDYTNPYFQYYTAPTALGLGLGGLLGGWKGSLLGAAGGAGLGALAKYLVDNDKIHMA